MTDRKDPLFASFSAHRDRLLRFLKRRIGCAETAEDLTQETWIRIARAGPAAAVEDAERYLFRVAANLATDHQRALRRRPLTAAEADALLAVPDDAPGPAETIQGRQEIGMLRRALAEMPARRREIFLAARIAGEPHRTIAARFGVSQRTIEMELRRALAHCGERLGRTPVRRFGPRE